MSCRSVAFLIQRGIGTIQYQTLCTSLIAMSSLLTPQIRS